MFRWLRKLLESEAHPTNLVNPHRASGFYSHSNPNGYYARQRRAEAARMPFGRRF